MSFSTDRRSADHQRTVIPRRPNSYDCADGASYAFSIPAFRREALLRGLDRIAMTIAREAEIATWQVWDRDHRPWIYTEIKGH